DTGDGADIAQQKIDLKKTIHKKLIDEFDFKNFEMEAGMDKKRFEEIKKKTREIIENIIANETGLILSREARAKVVYELVDEVLGLGPLESFLRDDSISEIMVNGPDDIFIEKAGKITLSGSRFTSEEQLTTVIDRILAPIGRRVDESSPLVDARLQDGSRVNVIIPPLSLIGPTITIRKFVAKRMGMEDLIRMNSITQDIVDFLKICVLLRKNMFISGGTGSGKTTLLNMLSSFIPEDERIVTVEDSAELSLRQKHVVTLESKPPNIEGKGAVPIRTLVINCLRMRPDRIIVGECRGGEALDMLQAMNTGHDGSMTTLHANTPKDAIQRLTTLVIMAGTELPEKAIKEQIASAMDIIIQTTRLSDGSRKIVNVTEMVGLDNGELKLQDLFCFHQAGLDKDRKVVGEFKATGALPSFYEDIGIQGLKLSKEIFKAD
ncbi:MAG: CpaF family protein, partial [Elusimicrobia bacterium]|nr:CpaF family protein [Elusimicrobiota bacterium]